MENSGDAYRGEIAVSKRKRTKTGDLAFMIILGGIVLVVLGERLALPIWVLLAIAVLGLWWFFAMPTKCDVITNRGRLCQADVKGKVNGCRWHAREKRDAIFAMFNVRNPGQMFRLAWTSQAPTVTTHPSTGESLTVSRHTAYEAIILVCTITSAVAAVAGTTFTAMGVLQG